VKIVRPKSRKILREIFTLSRLYHPNIVRYYSAWQEADYDPKAVGDESLDSSEGSDESSDSEESLDSDSGVGSSDEGVTGFWKGPGPSEVKTITEEARVAGSIAAAAAGGAAAAASAAVEEHDSSSVMWDEEEEEEEGGAGDGEEGGGQLSTTFQEGFSHFAGEGFVSEGWDELESVLGGSFPTSTSKSKEARAKQRALKRRMVGDLFIQVRIS